MKIKKLSQEKFGEIYKQVTRLCVEVIVKTPEGIILTRRNIKPYKGMWHIPGGTVLYGETLEETVKRVAKEELKLTVGIEKLLGHIYYPSEAKERGFGWTVGIAFLTYVEGGRLANNEQASDILITKEVPKDMIAEQKEFLEKNDMSR